MTTRKLSRTVTAKPTRNKRTASAVAGDRHASQAEATPTL
jgi:hypothetical protein